MAGTMSKQLINMLSEFLCVILIARPSGYNIHIHIEE